MKFLKLSAVILSLALFTSFSAHKFYVSITKIEYVKEQQSLQIITQVFIDDLEETLSERYGKEVHLDTANETEADVALFKKYVLDKFTVNVNGKPVACQYVGHEYDLEQVKVYLEITDIASLKTIEIENTIMMDKFIAQQNIIHLKTAKSRRSLILEKENPKGLLKFD